LTTQIIILKIVTKVLLLVSPLSI